MTTMVKPQPWHRLAELPGQKGVHAEWGIFPKNLLTLTRETASAVPCRRSASCYRQVVRHGPDDIVGVCSSDPVRCDKLPLDRMDITVYRLNHDGFFEVVNSAIGGEQLVEELDWAPNLWRIGTIGLYADKSLPVFHVFPRRPSDIDRAVHVICMRHPSPFLLFHPTASMASSTAYETAERHRGSILGLDDLLVVLDDGMVKSRRATIAGIEEWIQSLIPESAKPGSEFRFPTPPGAIWENIKMEFTADANLLVTCGSDCRVIEPEHLGMKDQRTGKPTEQWTLLKAFALQNGAIDWSGVSEKEKNLRKKQKQELSKKLRQVFQLDKDPIAWNKKECAYVCRFQITQSLPRGSREKAGLFADVA